MWEWTVKWIGGKYVRRTTTLQSHEVKYLLVAVRKDAAATETFGGTLRLSLAPSSLVETMFRS